MPTGGRTVKFSDFCTSWLATWAIVRLRASGYREYESVVRLHLVPAFGELTLDAVTAKRIQVYIADRIRNGLAPRSVDNHVIVLKRILSTAVDYGLISENPVDAVARPRADRPEMRFLEPAQLRQLIDACEPSWRLMLALPALVGLRKSECLATEWTDLNLEAMTISVSKSMRGGVVTTTLKTRGSVSQVPLPESLSPYIAQRRRQAGGHTLVFCKADGSPLADATPNRVLERALKAAYLPPMRFHDLRSSWAVAHLRAGTDIKTLAHLGRWSSPATLVSTYAHVIGIGGDAVRAFDEYYSQDS